MNYFLDEYIIVVQIEHRGAPSVFYFSDKKELIERAYDAYDLSYEKFTFDEAMKEWGSKEEIPQEMNDFFEKGASEVLKISFSETDEYYDSEHCISDYDAAKEAIEYDTQVTYFLSIKESKKLLSDGYFIRKHSCQEAHCELQKIVDFLEEE